MEFEFPSEKFIEDYICQKFNDELCPITLRYSHESRLYRQLDLGVYGIPDLVYLTPEKDSFYNEFVLVIEVLELKNTALKLKDYAQLSKYITGIRRMLEPYSKKLGFEVDVRGYLVGLKPPKCSEDIFLVDLIDDITTSYISLNMDDGFMSEDAGKGWFKVGESFRPIKHISREVASWLESEL